MTENTETCPDCGCPKGKTTHIVKRASGYVAGWFHGPPPQEFVDECNANVPGDPAHVEQLGQWPVCQHGVAVPADCPDCGGEARSDLPPGMTVQVVHPNERDVPVMVLPGTDYRVEGPDGQLAGWVISPGEGSGIDMPEAYGPDGKFIGTADDVDKAAAMIPLPRQPLSRESLDRGPETPGNPYQRYTPEWRVFEIAQRHGREAAAEAVAPGQATPDLRQLLQRIPELRSRPGSSASEPRRARTDDLPGYSQADLMSHADWVPHDGTMLRDELTDQHWDQARTAFWNEVERRCLAALPHGEVQREAHLGQRFITCRCGHRESGEVGDTIAEQNFAHHLKLAMEARDGS